MSVCIEPSFCSSAGTGNLRNRIITKPIAVWLRPVAIVRSSFERWTSARTKVPQLMADQLAKSPNPMLGLRSIRLSLRNTQMFKRQLRAILRASVHGNVRIMFRWFRLLLEFRQAKMILMDVMEDLEDEGIPFQRNVPVGMMVESAVGRDSG